MTRTGSSQEAARLHYMYCDGCGEYMSHSVVPANACKGNCGLVIHDDPKCPLKGKVVGGGNGEYDC